MEEVPESELAAVTEEQEKEVEWWAEGVSFCMCKMKAGADMAKILEEVRQEVKEGKCSPDFLRGVEGVMEGNISYLDHYKIRSERALAAQEEYAAAEAERVNKKQRTNTPELAPEPAPTSPPLMTRTYDDRDLRHQEEGDDSFLIYVKSVVHKRTIKLIARGLMDVKVLQGKIAKALDVPAEEQRLKHRDVYLECGYLLGPKYDMKNEDTVFLEAM